MSEKLYQIYAKIKKGIYIEKGLTEMTYDYQPYGEAMPHKNIHEFVEKLRRSFPMFDIQYQIIVVDRDTDAQDDKWDEALKDLINNK